ncbi:hypothetical protein G3578_18160 [Brevibacillus sp. SYP-B805]|uniref:hypothetical protein n=1 Tax=Brevibacillus sp. SYP-B805 TaxID=1578199 RepID=UPI0013EBB715|nr:hypothetical protein [Brevibacillus sp. SYP-B805]NGQ97067.1 hypothetical protein [Brevibacillus sp. SYP-B805]
MPNQRFAPHECLEVHELVAAKAICVEKAQAYLSQVTNPQLKALIQQDIGTARQHIQQLQQVFGR